MKSFYKCLSTVKTCYYSIIYISNSGYLGSNILVVGKMQKQYTAGNV